jgi:arabinan endo-1,5-alpha-L-arabinosidase
VLVFLSICSCEKEDGTEEGPDPTDGADTLDPGIADDYSAIASRTYSSQWGPYNLHDPTIIRYEDQYFIFSTDVAFGPNGDCGIMQRRSEDLVQWRFMGWVFDGVPPIALQFMEQYQPGYRQESIWAPFIYKHGDSYRLYYSVPGNDGLKLACIALATAENPHGPWADQGIVISCQPKDPYNAIDPAVVVDSENGKHWFAYGSYSSGIHMVELDPATGKRKEETDPGHLIAFRKQFNDAIEGAEFMYNDENGMYYLFVSYDWLEDDYNVRVGRSESPEGPYLDIHGNDMAAAGDNYPMITAQYRFDNHPGWQGLGHCGILKDEGNYFFVSQGRLGSNFYLMDLHVRRMVWTPSGWPMVSPERYAAVPRSEVTADRIAGSWEHISLVHTGEKNTSVTMALEDGGTIASFPGAAWSFEGHLLRISFTEGEIYECRVFDEWDWENGYPTLVYTGMNSSGECIWGKQIKP